MGIKIAGNAERPQDPELLECQKEMKQLCDEIVSLKPTKVVLTNWRVESAADAAGIQQRLRDSGIGELRLQDGDSLSAAQPDEYWPDLDLYVEPDNLSKVLVRAWMWEDELVRPDPDSPDKSPLDYIKYPSRKDWRCQLDVGLVYTDEVHSATEVVRATTGSASAGNIPTISRDVVTPHYRDMGYNGHNQLFLEGHDERAILGYVAIAREVFEQRA